MPCLEWDKLNKLQIGKYAEYLAKMEFTSYGFEVFTSEVDDRGIDFIVKDKKNRFLEIQVKSVRNMNFTCVHKDKFDIKNSNLYLVLIMFENSKTPDMFLIPAIAWQTGNELLKGSDYEGKKSPPEWRINISQKNMKILNKYKFEDKIQELEEQD
jgi:hypothetical protein